jgi:hypothetical protein
MYANPWLSRSSDRAVWASGDISARPSEFNGRSNDVTVAATESTRVASLVFAEQQGSRTSMVGSLSVPLLGHMGEPVGIRTTMRRDLTVHVKAWSHCAREEQDAREMSIDNTRFRFRVKA